MRVLRRIRSLVSTHAPQPTPADGTAGTARTDKKSIFTRALQGAVVLGAGLALTVGAAVAPQTAWAETDREAGIEVNLHDYDESTINNGHKLGFGDSRGEGWQNTWTNLNGGVAQGIVARNLGSGDVPSLSNTLGGESLSYLFSDNSAGRDYLNAGGLLVKDEETGYWEYDSSSNFAFVSATNSSGTTVTRLSYPRYTAKPGSSVSPGVAQFLPFNSLSHRENTYRNEEYQGSRYSYQGYDIASNSVTGVNTSDSQYDNSQSVHGKGNDYLFGMDISTEFLMPKDGIVNGENMIFEFDGDDDVWVYIDGMLVLDLGGIHDSSGGEINFATGVVSTDKVNNVAGSGKGNTGTTETLYDLYKKALEEKSLDSTEVRARLDEIFVKNESGNYVFKDYSTHTLKFFYLERGKGGSNCNIKFNLPTIPSGTINVGKNVDYANVNNVSDLDFTFKAYIDYDGDTTSIDGCTLYTGSYDIYDLDTNKLIQSGVQTADDGTITLKHGQYARISSGVMDNSKYYVVETGVNSSMYDVELVGTSHELEWIDGSTGTEEGIRTPLLSVSESAFVTFNNTVQADNSFNVEVKKDGKVEDGDVFYAMVMIGSRQYEGVYYLYDSDDDALGEQRTTNGGLIELMAGQHAEIRGIVGGNTVTVYEVNADGTAFSDEDYLDPTFSMENGNGTPLKNGASSAEDENGCKGIKGETNEGRDLGKNPVVEVVMTNTSALAHYELEVYKMIDGREWKEGDSFTFKIEGVGYYESSNDPINTDYDMPLPMCEEGSVDTEVTIDHTSQDKIEGAKVSTFCPITFNEPGYYIYKITEVAGEGDSDLVYDDPWYVRIQISDTVAGGGLDETGMWISRDGKSWDNARAAASRLLFVNRYVSLTFAGLQETKQVIGNDAEQKDFTFSVQANSGEAAELAGLSDLANNLTDGEYDSENFTLTFKNGQAIDADSQTAATVRSANQLTLTAANVGHTYVYEYAEVLGEDSKWHQEEETTWRVSVAVNWVDESAKDDIQATLTLEKKVGNGGWEDVETATFKSSDEKHAEPLTVSFTNVYNIYNLDIFKGELGKDVSGDPIADPDKPLSGAEFTLYSDKDCKNEVTTGTTSNGEEGVAKGHVILSGLEEESTYYLKETKVPSGYQLLDQTIVIKVERDQATFTILEDPSVEPKTVLLNKDTATFSFSVANKPNPEIPSTGSSGTVLMGGVGTAAIIVAGAWLLKQRGIDLRKFTSR